MSSSDLWRAEPLEQARPLDAEAATGPIGKRRPRAVPALLTVLTAATLFLAPLEGYVGRAGQGATKIAPALLIAVWLMSRLKTRTPPRQHIFFVVLGILAVIVLLSNVANSENPFGFIYVMRWLPYLALAGVLVDILSNEVAPRVAIIAALAGALVAASFAIYGFAFSGEPRATGPLEDPNDLAYILAAAVPLVLVLGASARTKGARLVGLGRTLALLILLLGIAATFSRGGFLALTALLIWAVMRRLVRPFALLIVPICVIVLAVLFWGAIGTHIEIAFQQKTFIAGQNIDSRTIRWGAASQMLAERPLLGVGPGGFKNRYATVSHNAELGVQAPVAHSMYIEVGAELGVLGLMAFLSLIGLGFAATEFAIRYAPQTEKREALAVQGSLIAVCVASTFLSEQYYMPLWGSLAIAIALSRRSSFVAH